MAMCAKSAGETFLSEGVPFSSVCFSSIPAKARNHHSKIKMEACP